jgi:hypothetical protein
VQKRNKKCENVFQKPAFSLWKKLWKTGDARWVLEGGAGHQGSQKAKAKARVLRYGSLALSCAG